MLGQRWQQVFRHMLNYSIQLASYLVVIIHPYKLSSAKSVLELIMLQTDRRGEYDSWYKDKDVTPGIIIALSTTYGTSIWNVSF